MKTLTKEILDYLSAQRLGVLSVEMLDGAPHAATVHFAHTAEPLSFWFETDKTYRKAEPLLSRKITRASLVIGFDERNMKTLQMDGEARLIEPEEKKLFAQVYLGKFPEKAQKYADAGIVSFAFRPLWWRWTDWTKPEGKIIVTSEDK